MKKATVIIPARYASTRFPGKPLALILGQPMIYHVYQRARQATMADKVIVATDDERIAKVVQGFGGEVNLTSGAHETGTNRVAEAAQALDSEWIINLQGDEPLVDPQVIDLLINNMRSTPQEKMFSLMRAPLNLSEYLDPQVVKVAVDNKGNALFFSRAPIPFPKGYHIKTLTSLEGLPTQDQASFLHSRLSLFENIHIHCGIYGFRKEFLLTIPSLPPSPLEWIESLEQLRVLANGYTIKMIETTYRSVGVDTPSDIALVEKILKEE